MSLLRGLLPRPVRRVMHPVRSTAGSIKRRATPKPVRKAQYARHPLGTATTRVGRASTTQVGRISQEPVDLQGLRFDQSFSSP